MPPKINPVALGKVLSTVRGPAPQTNTPLPPDAREFLDKITEAARTNARLEHLFKAGRYALLATKLNLTLNADGRDDSQHVKWLVNAALFSREDAPVNVAREFFRKLSQNFPDDFAKNIDAADFYYQVEDYQAARSSYLAACNIQPENPTVYFSLARTLNKLDRHDDALITFELALSIEPNNVSGIFDMALLLDDMDLDEEANNTYRRVLAIRPSHEEALINLLNLLEGDGSDGAYLQVQELYALYPDNFHCQTVLRRLAIRQGFFLSNRVVES